MEEQQHHLKERKIEQHLPEVALPKKKGRKQHHPKEEEKDNTTHKESEIERKYTVPPQRGGGDLFVFPNSIMGAGAKQAW